jgi:hypothetical protein
MDIILCLIIVSLCGIDLITDRQIKRINKRLKEIEDINFNIRVEADRREIESAVNRIVRDSYKLSRDIHKS